MDVSTVNQNLLEAISNCKMQGQTLENVMDLFRAYGHWRLVMAPDNMVHDSQHKLTADLSNAMDRNLDLENYRSVYRCVADQFAGYVAHIEYLVEELQCNSLGEDSVLDIAKQLSAVYKPCYDAWMTLHCFQGYVRREFVLPEGKGAVVAKLIHKWVVLWPMSMQLVNAEFAQAPKRVDTDDTPHRYILMMDGDLVLTRCF